MADGLQDGGRGARLEHGIVVEQQDERRIGGRDRQVARRRESDVAVCLDAPRERRVRAEARRRLIDEDDLVDAGE